MVITTIAIILSFEMLMNFEGIASVKIIMVLLVSS